MSQRGRDCPDNRDMGGCCISGRFVYAMNVDISQRGPRGAGFARDWTRIVLENVCRCDSLSATEAITIMKKACQELRHDYPAESGSYAAVILDSQNSVAHGISCGDCRLGMVHGDRIEWLSSVHTLATSLWNTEEASIDFSRNRHTLTRCLRARRFETPDMLRFEPGTASILLATDGYWAEHLIEKVPLGQLLDDASCLTLSLDDSPLVVNSDCDNWIATRNSA